MTTTILRANGVSFAQYTRITDPIGRHIFRRLLILGWLRKRKQ